MKWNILVGSMVLGLGLSTQGFGDLLDRMLGSNGCGCVQKSGCAQKCGDLKCDGKDGCAQKDGCGQKACEPKCGRRPLLAGCAQKDDGCKDPCQKDGSKDPCADKGCVQKSCGPSLLERIFARRNACCDSKGGKGSDGKGDKAVDDKLEPTADAPVPPAPVVDPSAFLKSQRQVITASASLVR